MSRKTIDISGQTFGRLTVVRQGITARGGKLWLCLCLCGNEKYIYGYQLRNGAVISCGCQHRESAARNIRLVHSLPHPRLSHGETFGGETSPEYSAWRNVVKAGAVERWQDIGNFLADLGRKPSRKHCLCRQDSGQLHGPENSFWGTAKWRAQNRRAGTKKQAVIFVDCRGERLALADWSARSGVKIDTIRGRLRSGWAAEQAIFTPADVSSGLRHAWANGLISPRKPIYTPQEKLERQREAARRRYAQDPEGQLEKIRKWHEANPGRKQKTVQKYLDKHRNRLNDLARQQRKTPEKKAYMRKYATAHRENNPHLYSTYSNSRRSRQLGAFGDHSTEQWVAKLRKFSGRCAYCGLAGKMSRDHAIPLARCGSNDISNILPACRPCNSAKGMKTADEFFRHLAGEDLNQDERWAALMASRRSSRRRSA